MAAHADREWSELALSGIARGGRRRGAARHAVIDVLARGRCCVSAQEIAESIRARGDRVGTASVYRALELLEVEGLVQRVEVGDGGARYEPVVPGGDHHHHAICDTCGRLTPFEDAALERAMDRLTAHLGYSARTHDVLIRGECERCERS